MLSASPAAAAADLQGKFSVCKIPDEMVNVPKVDVPPLEDMSDKLQRRAAARAAAVVPPAPAAPSKPATRTHDRTTLSGGKPLAKAPPSQPAPKPKAARPDTFGSMRRGFLLGGLGDSKPRKPAPSAPSAEKPAEITTLRPTRPRDDSLRFDEVQDAIKQGQSLLDRKEWLTDDFITAVDGNPLFQRVAQDPEWSEALDLFQKDPAAALRRFGQRKPQFVQALLAFSGALGQQLEKLADQQDSRGPTVPGRAR